MAGLRFRALGGTLWGDFFNVPREPLGDGVFVYPLEGTSIAPQYPAPPDWFPVPTPDFTPPGTFFLQTAIVMPGNGTFVHMVGHVHPGGLETVVANLGPEGSACGADLDGDGLPGVTLMRSRKIDRNPAGGPATHYKDVLALGVSDARVVRDAEIARLCDRLLGEINGEYKIKRDSGRLGAVRVVRMGLAEFANRAGSHGASWESQFKFLPLSRETWESGAL
jgi:hypothetical protein